MASALSTEKLGSTLYIKSYDHDPGGTTAILAGPDGGTTIRYLDLRDYETVGVMVKPSIVGGNGVTKVEIVASEAVAFSSVTVVKDSGSIQADALDDNVFLECTAEEVAQLGSEGGLNLRYVAARLTCASAGDEATVTYIAIPKRAYTGLTATSIA